MELIKAWCYSMESLEFFVIVVIKTQKVVIFHILYMTSLSLLRLWRGGLGTKDLSGLSSSPL